MAQNYNASAGEILYQHILLTEPITIPANGSAKFRIVAITKRSDNQESGENDNE